MKKLTKQTFKQTFAKKTVAASLAMVLSVTSVTANASLSSAVNNFTTKHGGMGTAVDAHTFKTATQRGFHAGSVDIRFPVKAINLVSVERASVNVGCNGVSITFGGMAFISADEIIEYLKTIAKGVPALIYAMTLKAIAAPLEAALNKLYTTMERLSAAMKNSCEVSQQLVGAMGNQNIMGYTASGVGSSMANSWSGLVGITDKGLDPLDREVAKNLDKASNWWKSKVAGGAKPISPAKEIDIKECIRIGVEYGVFESEASKKATTDCEAGGSFHKKASQIATVAKHTGLTTSQAGAMFADKTGNTTWNALQLYGFAPGNPDAKDAKDQISQSVQGNLEFAQLLLSMLGAKVFIDGEEEEKNLENTITATEFVTLFMCGKKSDVDSLAIEAKKDKNNINTELADWCKNRWDEMGDKTTWVCDNPTGVAGTACLNPTPQKLTKFNHNFISKQKGGMLFYISKIMQSSVQKASAGEGQFDNEEKMLMVISPLPIYEVYNVAAAVPFVADQLLQNNALLITFSMLDAMFAELLSSVTEAGVTFGQGTIQDLLPHALHQIMFDMQDEITKAFVSEIKYVNLYQQESENLIANIKAINRQVLQGSMALGLNGQAFVDSLTELTK